MLPAGGVLLATVEDGLLMEDFESTVRYEYPIGLCTDTSTRSEPFFIYGNR